MKKKNYTYEDMPDKSIEGIKKEVNEGLPKIAFYFYSVHGFPIEIFKDEFSQMKSFQEQLLFYMRFRSDNPDVFK